MSKIEYPKMLYHWNGQHRTVQNAQAQKALGEGWEESPNAHTEFWALKDWVEIYLATVNPNYDSDLTTVVREQENWRVPAFKFIDPAGKTYFLFPPSTNVKPGDLLHWLGEEQWLVTATNKMRDRITAEVQQATPRHIEVALSDDVTEKEFDDLLAGTYRRKLFDRDFPVHLSEAANKSQSLSLLMIDLDKFKGVNDRYGHQIGDQVLTGCAELLTARLEGKGKAYRYGGEEIAVVLRNFSCLEAEAVAETLRQSIQDTGMSSEQLKVTVSIGVACFPDHATDAESLLKRADEALYKAKNTRRNLVWVSGQQEELVAQERKVQKRQPEPDKLTDEEQEAIRHSYLTTGCALCPRDDVPLRFVDVTHMGLKTPAFIVTCPYCGLEDHLPGLPQENG